MQEKPAAIDKTDQDRAAAQRLSAGYGVAVLIAMTLVALLSSAATLPY